MSQLKAFSAFTNSIDGGSSEIFRLKHSGLASTKVPSTLRIPAFGMSVFGAGFLSGLTGNETSTVPEQTTFGPFRVVLECPEGENFGVTMGGHPSVQGLLVIDVLETTAVRTWNDKNPQRRIELGQAVLEVNGISEPRAAMFQAFRDTKTVELVLSWELSPKQREVLRSSSELHRRKAIVEDMLQDVHGEEPCMCAICHEEGGEEEAQLPCGHRFHKACVRKWLVFEHLRCPLCNSQKMRM